MAASALPEMRTRLDDALTGGRREAAACATEQGPRRLSAGDANKANRGQPPTALHVGPPAIAEAAACAAVLAVAFALDRLSPMWGQIAAGFGVWAFALAIIERASGLRRRMLFAILAWATVGELFCSLAWGLYTYRLGNIPHFVPPGHVLVFLIGMQLARAVTPAMSDRLTAGYAVLAACAAVFLGDELSVLLFAVYLLVYRLKPDLRALLATMFMVTFALELAGTTLGTWAWAPRTPALGLATTNPPFSVAAFYCVLDTLVFLTVQGRLRRLVELKLSTR